MSSQHTEAVELGALKATSASTTSYTVPHIAASLVVVLYDVMNKVGGVAHVILPESTINAQSSDQEGEAKYADLAIPKLVNDFTEQGGDLSSAIVRIVGGAQLFNFGGGSGNVLNIGARNAVAVKTALSRHGLAVDKEEIGGNKTRSLVFNLMDGKVTVKAIGGQEIVL